MDEESAKLIANALILRYFFGISSEDLEDEEIKNKCTELIGSDFESFGFINVSVIQQKLVDLILKR